MGPFAHSPLGIGALILGALSLFGLLIRQIGPWRRQLTETEEHMRQELVAQVAAIEAKLDAERTRHSDQLIAHNKEREKDRERIEKLERRLERQQLRHNAERSLDRHRLNNIQQCFDALLLLVETNPEKAQSIVVKIKEMRAQQVIAEAEEKAIIRAAEITADEGEQDHDGN
jgi:hypothetical protein